MTWKNFKLFGKSEKRNSSPELIKSEFEKIKVFKNLPKEQWKSAYNELNKIIALNLKEYGFKKKGRKHFRLTNDLLEIIDIDNRGSWQGSTDEIKIRIGLVPFCWEGLTNEYYLVGSKKIEEIDKSIRSHFRISQEYLILADYISERLINNILPYFDKYNSTKKIITNYKNFPYDLSHLALDSYNNHKLILFSELKQHKIKESIEILNKKTERIKDFKNNEYLKKWFELRNLVENENWKSINKIITEKEQIELKKLKIKPVANTV